MQRYTTNNLLEAVSTLAKLKASGQAQNLLFQIPARFAALFCLVKMDGIWKVEDVYLVAMGDKEFPDWVALSRDHKQLLTLVQAAPQPLPEWPQK
ncbi:MAG TPA: hypothetical protein VE988_04535, partial [Gemmataceae bacterium]|nr:hypothetical protein [Gemmataceae bacterium]